MAMDTAERVRVPYLGLVDAAVARRCRVEGAIARRTYRDLVKAGYRVVCADSAGVKSTGATEAAQLSDLFSCESGSMLVYRADGMRIGWVDFVWGNGSDCLSDYSVALDSIIDPIYDWISERWPEGVA